MRRAIQMILSIAVVATSGCGGMGQGKCVFDSPSSLTKLTMYEDFPFVATRHKDPSALLLITGVGEPRGAPMDALRIDSVTGRQTIDKVPEPDQTGWKKFPLGYTFWISDPGLIQRPVAHPLVRSGTLRIAFTPRGHSGPIADVPGGALNRRVRIVEKNRYTGDLAVMFGEHKLLSQRLVNWTHIPALDNYVVIEPEGDRIACLCNDDRGSWLAVFHRNTLAAEQQKATR